MAGNAYNYKGNGDEFIAGIPARSMTADEVAALPPESRLELEAHVAAGGSLYAEGKSVGDVPKTKASDVGQPVYPTDDAAVTGTGSA